MSPRSFRTRLAAAAVAVLGACHDSSSSSGVALTNLGLAALSLRGTGELWVLEVAELAQDATDLNGDGDLDDRVLFVHDLGSGTLRNLALGLGRSPGPGERGFPAPFLAMGSVLVAFAVSEAEQGAADLNGDGDADDAVLHVYDHRTGIVTNVGLAPAPLAPSVAEGFVAFAVLESAQGDQDLDGDGTSAGSVLHVYDSRTRLAHNAARHASSPPVFQGPGFAFTTDETFAGDRNADGDVSDDSVLQFHDVLVGSTLDVPLAVLGPPLGAHDEWVVLVSEPGQGADLDADGDALDGVYHEVDPHALRIDPLGLSSNQLDGSMDTHDRLALVVQEVDGFDRNGDGDLLDTILALYDQRANSVFDTGLAISTGALGPHLLGELVAVGVSEADQALDLDGDGDLLDVVVHLIDPVLGTSDNLGVDALTLQAFDGLLAITRNEASAGEDWNRDGDQVDLVLFLLDPPSADLASTRISCWGQASAASDGALLLIAPEEGEQRDLNGDGDQLDLVPVLHDLASHANRSLGVAVSLPDAGLTPDGRGIFLVHEASQGADLNGDGDLDDSVAHVLE